MKYSVLVILFLLSCSTSKMLKTDTEEQIRALSNTTEIKQYWEQLYVMDQKFRGKDYNSRNDLENLIKVCLMIEHHGYPSKSEFGFSASTAPWIIWAHNPSFEAQRISFPIIQLALESENIPPGLFPDYFVRGAFVNKYGREFNNDYTIESTNPKLNLNLSDNIEIDELVNASNAMLTFLKIETKKTIGRFMKVEDQDTTIVNIHQKINDKYYYDEEYEDGSYATQKLIESNSTSEFKYANNLYGNMLKIESNRLVLLNERGQIIEQYKEFEY